ncbi:MAG: hypothetical protein AABY86_04390 [Bdellovibrionota bacterium]
MELVGLRIMRAGSFATLLAEVKFRSAIMAAKKGRYSLWQKRPEGIPATQATNCQRYLSSQRMMNLLHALCVSKKYKTSLLKLSFLEQNVVNKIAGNKELKDVA